MKCTENCFNCPCSDCIADGNRRILSKEQKAQKRERRWVWTHCERQIKLQEQFDRCCLSR